MYHRQNHSSAYAAALGYLGQANMKSTGVNHPSVDIQPRHLTPRDFYHSEKHKDEVGLESPQTHTGAVGILQRKNVSRQEGTWVKI